MYFETAGGSVRAALIDAAANVLPLAILAAASHALLKTQFMPHKVVVQSSCHVAFAVIFATTWYALILVVLAFFSGVRGHGFAVTSFGPAFTLQVY